MSHLLLRSSMSWSHSQISLYTQTWLADAPTNTTLSHHKHDLDTMTHKQASELHVTFTVSNGCPTAIPTAPAKAIKGDVVASAIQALCCICFTSIFLPEMLPATNSKNGMTSQSARRSGYLCPFNGYAQQCIYSSLCANSTMASCWIVNM